ncbi:hypothetical protein [Schaalia sp. Marseille-Q2122]|uniref:hypothetical protein n=1 Tax=Schaalia sp. Marseille-Q2122 TaxID=2736604 RepID=UPI00158C35BA|nr:hypothetical protein [Schaalia sp. Marseille-Q2122]
MEKYRFGWTYDHQIKRPEPQHLLTAVAAVGVAVLWPAIVPNVEPFFIALQAFISSGVFLAGAHRTSRIRIAMPIVVTAVITGVVGRLAPQAIPAGFLLVHAFFTFGNAWKYWYLQQDPARLSPHYRYFKDPNTQPQRHIIRGVLLAPSTFLIGGILGLIIQGLHLATRETSGRIATIIIILLLLLSALEVVIGIVQLIRRLLRRRAASSKARPA